MEALDRLVLLGSLDSFSTPHLWREPGSESAATTDIDLGGSIQPTEPEKCQKLRSKKIFPAEKLAVSAVLALERQTADPDWKDPNPPVGRDGFGTAPQLSPTACTLSMTLKILFTTFGADHLCAPLGTEAPTV
jgi:hypothetical protein